MFSVVRFLVRDLIIYDISTSSKGLRTSRPAQAIYAYVFGTRAPFINTTTGAAKEGLCD